MIFIYSFTRNSAELIFATFCCLQKRRMATRSQKPTANPGEASWGNADQLILCDMSSCCVTGASWAEAGDGRGQHTPQTCSSHGLDGNTPQGTRQSGLVRVKHLGSAKPFRVPELKCYQWSQGGASLVARSSGNTGGISTSD